LPKHTFFNILKNTLKWENKNKAPRQNRFTIVQLNLCPAHLRAIAPNNSMYFCSSGHIRNGRTADANAWQSQLASCREGKENGGPNRCHMPEVKLKRRRTNMLVAVAVAASAMDWMLQLPPWMLHLFQKYTRRARKPTNKTEGAKHRNCTWHASIFGQLAFVFVPCISTRTAVKIVLVLFQPAICNPRRLPINTRLDFS